MIDENHNRLSIRKQCNLLSLSRSGFYATRNRKPSKENLELMQLLDQKYTKHPSLGSRRLRALLRREGRRVNRKRVQRLMRLMGIAGVAPKPNLSRPAPGHKVFPYLLRNVPIERVDQVWSSDITYIPLPDGFMYLVAVIDWRSQYVLSWELSNSLDRSFCVEALRNALRHGTPEIFNTDQGSQYTAEEFTGILKERGHPPAVYPAPPS
jgi:putative transposase